jgi:ubiquinone/menaquinone biosynthesis C-methylase UbiE
VSKPSRDQFAPVAANYATSFFHADPARLEEVMELASPAPGELALDVATGTGNVALALARRVDHAVGLDLTPQMLAQAVRLASERGLSNTSWVLGEASALPFAAGVFDVYTVRAAPHHFTDLEGALREAVRVLRPGGRACFVDCSPPAAARDHLHAIEIGRDPSHVRSRTLDEWTRLIEEAGLRVEQARRRELEWDFDKWMANMAVPAGRAAELAARLEAAVGRARVELRPERRSERGGPHEGRLWHTYWHALIQARKP